VRRLESGDMMKTRRTYFSHLRRSFSFVVSHSENDITSVGLLKARTIGCVELNQQRSTIQNKHRTRMKWLRRQFNLYAKKAKGVWERRSSKRGMLCTLTILEQTRFSPTISINTFCLPILTLAKSNVWQAFKQKKERKNIRKTTDSRMNFYFFIEWCIESCFSQSQLLKNWSFSHCCRQWVDAGSETHHWFIDRGTNRKGCCIYDSRNMRNETRYATTTTPSILQTNLRKFGVSKYLLPPEQQEM
jgi:hypothetical protein